MTSTSEAPRIEVLQVQAWEHDYTEGLQLLKRHAVRVIIKNLTGRQARCARKRQRTHAAI